MANDIGHLKKFGNSFEAGDLIRFKRMGSCASANVFWSSRTRRVEFPFGSLFVCLQVEEDGETWTLLAPSGEYVRSHHKHFILERFANEKDEEETDGKQCV